MADEQAGLTTEPGGFGDDLPGGDCSDTDGTRSPSAVEVWYDGVDQDCAGDDDYDADQDGYQADVDGGSGLDCDDTDAAVNPDAADDPADGVDNDCDGLMDAGSLWLADLVLEAEEVEDFAGDALAVLGDTDGDGKDDLAIGGRGPRDSSDVGVVHIVLWPGTGTESLSNAHAAISSADTGTNYGETLGWVGDLNDDGVADVAMGATTADGGGTDRGGEAYIFFGPITSGSTTIDNADVTYGGVADRDNLGSMVHGAGDLDNDGDVELLVGAYGVDTPYADRGAVYLVEGPIGAGSSTIPTSTKIYGNGRLFGYGAAIVGDLDGDGVDSVALTSNSTRDRVTLMSGDPGSGTLSESDVAEATAWGLTTDDDLGKSVAGGEDIDGDGYGDLVLGADNDDTNATNAGRAWVLLGPVSSGNVDEIHDAVIEASTDNGYLGRHVVSLGDSDGDGLGDVVVDRRNVAGLGKGSIMRFSGPTSGTLGPNDADETWVTAPYTTLSSLTSGDLDGDGDVDLVVGSAGADTSTGTDGQIYIFYGFGS